jgi:predicted exporter
MLASGLGILAWRGLPTVDHSTQPLSPHDSAADADMQELLRQFDRGRNPVLLLVEGRSEAEVRARLEALQGALDTARADLPTLKAELPLALWPSPVHQQANQAAAQRLSERSDHYRDAILAAGFNEAATLLATGVFKSWQSQMARPGVAWPETESSRWLLSRVVGHTGDQWLALGTVSGVSDEDALRVADRVQGVTASGWQMLGEALLDHVADRVGWLMAGMILAVALCLRMTLGTWGMVLMSFASLAVGLILLLEVMSLAGWSWNLMNLPALPLLLGASVDYSIHVLHSLRRHGGDLPAMHRGTGRALLLCGGTTMAAFGSLAFSSNAGLASLGQVCAVGVACVLVSTLYLMPAFAYPARR